jgi:hypothetical protein
MYAKENGYVDCVDLVFFIVVDVGTFVVERTIIVVIVE